MYMCVWRYCTAPESKSFYDAFGESSNELNGDNDVITENLALETHIDRRNRLGSFYSAISAKSTYFSTGSVNSSYHSIGENDSEIGTLLLSNDVYLSVSKTYLY